MDKKWYQNTILMWFMLVFCFPVGLILMWKYSDYSQQTKTVITAVVAIAVFGYMTMGNDDTSTLPQWQMNQTDSDGFPRGNR